MTELIAAFNKLGYGEETARQMIERHLDLVDQFAEQTPAFIATEILSAEGWPNDSETFEDDDSDDEDTDDFVADDLE